MSNFTMYIAIAVIGLLFYFYKYLMNLRIKGETLKISNFRAESNISHLLPLEVVIEEIKKDSKEDIWLICFPEKPLEYNEVEYDLIYIKPKSVDDNINKKKGTVCYFTLGNSSDRTIRKFADWAIVEIIEK